MGLRLCIEFFLFSFQTPPRPALFQERPQEILLPKEKFEKFEKRMQTPDKVSIKILEPVCYEKWQKKCS